MNLATPPLKVISKGSPFHLISLLYYLPTLLLVGLNSYLLSVILGLERSIGRVSLFLNGPAVTFIK